MALTPAQLVIYTLTPMAVYALGVGRFVSNWDRRRPQDGIWAGYLLLCLAMTAALTWGGGSAKQGYLPYQIFKVSETLFLGLYLESGEVLPRVFGRRGMLSLLAILPFLALALSDPGRLDSLRNPLFHTLTFTQLLICTLGIGFLSRQDHPMARNAAFWVAMPMLFNAGITLLVYLWTPEFPRGSMEFQAIHMFRAVAVAVLYAMMARAFTCPYPPSRSSAPPSAP